MILVLAPGPARIAPESNELPAAEGATARKLPDLVLHALSEDEDFA
jgi:hypothetical protein